MTDPHIAPRGKLMPTATPAVTVPAFRACRMKDCTGPGMPAAAGLCVSHVQRLAQNQRSLPCKVVPYGDDGSTQTVCGLCGQQVYMLARIDDPQRAVWAIDSRPAPLGRCWIVDGGFRVVTSDRQLNSLISDKVPLFQTHRATCAVRAEIVGEAGDGRIDT